MRVALSTLVYLQHISNPAVAFGPNLGVKFSGSLLLLNTKNRKRVQVATTRSDPSLNYQKQYFTCAICLKAKSFGDNEEEEDDDEDDISLDDDADWRSFRAKLVMGESKTTSKSSSSTKEESPSSSSSIVEDDFDGIGALFEESSSPYSSDADAASSSSSSSSLLQGMTPLDPSQWAYESGKIIEQGAVILGGVEQDFGFGLRQQYFHKAAILVLEHDETTFTKGIILNRPTDLVLDDDLNPDTKWRVWFGGDVQGIESANPSIVCLHSVKSNRAVEASVPVMKDIQWTTFDNAKKLVKSRECTPNDFWVFVGYAGWSPGQLMGELERNSWYMVATDSQTLLKELARQGAGADPRDAGLETWDLLMNMIGRQETAKENSGGFDDLMLKEWALSHLLSTEAGGGAGIKNRLPSGVPIIPEKGKSKPLDALFQRKKPVKFGTGSLVRGSPDDRSPFLLDHQILHKSIVLIIADEDSHTIGAILNRPVSRGLAVNISDKESGESRNVKLPLRFGGEYTPKGDEQLLWLHCNPSLRRARIGSPVGHNGDGIWKCTANDVVSAVTRGLASPEEFFVVTGVSVWAKNNYTPSLQEEIEKGHFEVMPDKNTQAVWDILAKQYVLSDTNLSHNLEVGEQAWSRGGEGLPTKNNKKNGNFTPISGLGEGFDEDDDSLVFKTDVKVSSLSDDALRSWISAFFLGAPYADDD